MRIKLLFKLFIKLILLPFYGLLGMDCSEEYIRMEMECEPKKSFWRGLKDL